MSKKNYKHTYIGNVYDISIQSDQTTAMILIQGEEAGKMPLCQGQFIILTNKFKPNTAFLGRLEQLTPDFAGLAVKEAIRQGSKGNMGVDKHYQKEQGVSYKCKILGVCFDEPNNFKFYANIRTFPSIFDLEVAIPDPEYMRKICQTSISDSDNQKEKAIVEVGTLCYGTFPEYTNKYYDPSKEDSRVPIFFNTSNLFRKRTGIFGSSGSGKSNSVKTMIGSLRAQHPDSGLLLLDTNGEYALDNTQNDGLFDILHDANMKGTYSLYTGRKLSQGQKDKHGKDVFKPLKFDVFSNIKPSFEIIMANVESSVQYLNAWTTEIEGEEDARRFFNNFGDTKGLIWGIWYACLQKAGLAPVQKIHPYQAMIINRSYVINKVFQEVIIQKYMQDGCTSKDEVFTRLLSKYGEDWTWEHIYKVFSENPNNIENFDKQLKDDGISFEMNSYRTKRVDVMIKYAQWKLKQMEEEKDKQSSLSEFKRLYDNPRRLTALKAFHLSKDEDRKTYPTMSLGESVWQDLKSNKMVILDLASIPIRVSKSLSAHILHHLLSKATAMFGDPAKKKIFDKFEALIFIEEAQNYLGPEEVRNGSIYERMAKEGRKFHFGLCYITQQPSAIDQSITSQTENIVALHMGSYKDSQVLNQINDKFDALTCKFIKDEVRKGLAYFYSKPYQPFVLPVQTHLFTRDFILKSKKKKKK